MYVIGTAGHVDHGKSALVQALTGIDPDRLLEEKARGLTIDLGFAWFQTVGGRQVSIVDVPGHERFIRNMLAGVGTVDSCLFVVAANEGWKPQSEEHLRILDLLGVQSGIVVLTKVGLADTELCDIAELEISDHLEGESIIHRNVCGKGVRQRQGEREMYKGIREEKCSWREECGQCC